MSSSNNQGPPPSGLRGFDLLHHPRYNKGTAFSEAERAEYGLHGLLPPRRFSMEEQVARAMGNLRRKESDLERYIFLTSMEDRNERLFYRLVIDHITEVLPIIYTPTVGEACLQFGDIFRRSRGLYITAGDRGRIGEVLANWPTRDVDVIVVTDGERILGLGDLGAQGMGIPIGKLSLYTACAGIDPANCLPITIDVGTDNDTLRARPFYPGHRQRRVRGEEYDALLEEFVQAVTNLFPDALLQWEDFATPNALRLLATYRDRLCTFNDDVQGTAGVTLAGLFTACRITGRSLAEQRVVFFGAGSAAVGIADLIVSAMVQEGLTEEEAKAQCWLVDSKGLVVASRTDLQSHKRPYAHDHPPLNDLESIVRTLSPTALFGLSAQPGAFQEPVLRAMAEVAERPIVFVLSNPTSRAECTAAEAYAWTEGKALFASGSPFDPVVIGGKQLVPRQANNAYVFPGLGLGVVVSRARRVTDSMFHAAARALAETVETADLDQGALYPPLTAIREVSRQIAIAVARVAEAEGLTSGPLPSDLAAAVATRMYDPRYP